MKKLYSLCLLVFSFGLAQAQIKKGNTLIGASLGNSSIILGEGVAAFSLRANPTVGVMLTNNWMAGAGVSLGTIVSDGFTGLVGVNPFARYYYNSKNSRDSLYKSFFLQGGIGLAAAFGEIEQSSVYSGLGGGYCRFITPDVGLELATSANFVVPLGSNNDGHINIGFSLGLQIVLDKNLHLFKRKKP